MVKSRQEAFVETSVEDVHININDLPSHKMDVLAAATMDFVRWLKSNPKGLEAFEAKRTELNLR